jgi:UDP-glucose 4-epimerase
MRLHLIEFEDITNCDLQFMNADIRDTNALDKIFNTFKPEAVIHFAG